MESEDIEQRYEDEVVEGEVVDLVPINVNGKVKKAKEHLPTVAKAVYFANVNLSNQLINKLSPKAIKKLDELLESEDPNIVIQSIKTLSGWISAGSPKINYQAIKYMGNGDEEEEKEDNSLQNVLGDDFKDFMKYKMEKDRRGSDGSTSI